MMHDARPAAGATTLPLRLPLGLALGLTLGLTLGLALGGLAARAEGASDCHGFGALAESPGLAFGRVAAVAPRAHFVLGPSGGTGCPDASLACRDKAFVVPGDPVIVSTRRGPLACVEFIGPRGAVRAGWLPATALILEQPRATPFTGWLGTWTRAEAEVTIKTGSAGRLSIQGSATYGALDPGRVRRGAVNIGAIAGLAVPSGASLAFTSGLEEGRPGHKDDAGECRVWMRRLGPYLAVDDNGDCGGHNVSFRGIYRRQPG